MSISRCITNTDRFAVKSPSFSLTIQRVRNADIGISHLESAEFMHLRISAPVDSQAPIIVAF
jgi:hypothetical protein